jgi:hypothetical protein
MEQSTQHVPAGVPGRQPRNPKALDDGRCGDAAKVLNRKHEASANFPDLRRSRLATNCRDSLSSWDRQARSVPDGAGARPRAPRARFLPLRVP